MLYYLKKRKNITIIDVYDATERLIENEDEVYNENEHCCGKYRV